MSMQLIDCEETIMREITDPQMTPRDVSQTYALILQSSEAMKVNWHRVNTAIIERWSKTALIKIKTDAHSGKCFADAATREENP